MQCLDCPYCYRDDDNDDFARCHFERQFIEDRPPCDDEEDYFDELNDFEEEYDDYFDEVGYDPYLGCYSEDC